MLIAEPFEAFQRKSIVDAFRLLQAKYIGPRRFEEFGDEIDAKPHRIDVPGGQGKAHRDGEHSVSNGQACRTTYALCCRLCERGEPLRRANAVGNCGRFDSRDVGPGSRWWLARRTRIFGEVD